MVDLKVESVYDTAALSSIDANPVYGPAGKDGATPEIGENGNWWINGIDTGKPSRGEDGSAADLVNYYNKQEVDSLISPVSENATEALGLAEENQTKIGSLESSVAGKQGKLTAGENISIVSDTISATMPVASATEIGGVKVGAGLAISEDGTLSAVGGGSSGISDYEELTNKPQINSIELSGNKTLSDLGIQAAGDYATKTELNAKADSSALDDYYTSTEADAKFATITQLNGKADASELSSYALKTEIPTKTSDLANDSGFLTSVPEEYVTETEMSSAIAGKADTSALSDYLTKTEASSTYATADSVNEKQDKDIVIEDLTDIANIQNNHVYKMTLAEEITMVYPEVTNTNISNSVIIYLHVTADISINWGADVYFYNKKIPTIATGDFDVVLLYNPNLSKWCVSCIEVGAAS